MRVTTPEEFDAIYDIYMDETVSPYLFYEPRDRSGFKPIFEELLKADDFFVHEESGEVIGMCTCRYGKERTSHVAHIGTFAIHPKHQGHGHAQKFLNNVVDHLKDKNFRRIELWAEADNPKALKFYQKMGFQEDGRVPKYYKRASSDKYVDEVIMSKWF